MQVEVPFTFVDEAALQGDEDARQLLCPRYRSAEASGLDLVAAGDLELPSAGGRGLVPTGVALALPAGLEAQVRPRSGLALEHGVTVLNAPGTIDSDYRGEIKVLLINHGDRSFQVKRGDRVAQLVVQPVNRVALEVVLALPASDRGTGGFGSTGAR